MKILKTTSLILLIMMLIGCSASAPRPIQPDKITPLSEISDLDASQQDNELNRTAGMDIPYPPPDMYWIRNSLRLYWQTTGQFPETMNGFIESGFPLIWPRESSKKIPFFLSVDEDYIPGEELFGSFQYNRISSDKVQYKYVYMDFKTYRGTGEITWKVKTTDIPFADKQSLNPGGVVKELEGILVLGGEKRVDLISDSDTRLLYALCGQFASFLETMTDIHYNLEGTTPSNFNALLGPEQLIIKENFDAFAKLLESSNAEFKWGFDNDKNTSYTYLKINNDILITRCLDYNAENILEQGDCDFKTLDISSPIITERNITSMEIPEEYLIALKDIPVNGN